MRDRRGLLPLGTEAKAHINPFIFPFITQVFTSVDKEPINDVLNFKLKIKHLNLLAISFAAWSTLLFQQAQACDRVYVDNAAKTAIFQCWHDAQTLTPQAHPNLQTGLAWYIAGSLKDHPQKNLERVIAHQTWHPEVSE